MPGTSTTKKPMIDERGSDRLSPEAGRQRSSILGLSIVSGLNVACLGFIAYHFTVHSSEPEVAPNGPPALSDKAVTETPAPAQMADMTSGNVELVHASRRILSIASGFDLTTSEPAGRKAGVSLASTDPAASNEASAAGAAEPSGHGVQLGALSKEATARNYWSALKLRHQSLLRGREPRYFSPAEVGGGLYHIRLGPMAVDAAAGLCERLDAEGADCFCVSPLEDGIS